MCGIICLVVMSEECVIESELEDESYQRQRYGQQRQDAEFARCQLARIHRNEHQPERAVDRAADAEDQRVLYRLLDLVVDRDRYSCLRFISDNVSPTRVRATAAILT